MGISPILPQPPLSRSPSRHRWPRETSSATPRFRARIWKSEDQGRVQRPRSLRFTSRDASRSTPSTPHEPSSPNTDIDYTENSPHRLSLAAAATGDLLVSRAPSNFTSCTLSPARGPECVSWILFLHARLPPALLITSIPKLPLLLPCPPSGRAFSGDFFGLVQPALANREKRGLDHVGRDRTDGRQRSRGARGCGGGRSGWLSHESARGASPSSLRLCRGPPARRSLVCEKTLSGARRSDVWSHC